MGFLAAAKANPSYDANWHHNYDDWPIPPDPWPAVKRAVSLFAREVGWLEATDRSWGWRMPGDEWRYGESESGKRYARQGFYPILELIGDVYANFPVP